MIIRLHYQTDVIKVHRLTEEILKSTTPIPEKVGWARVVCRRRGQAFICPSPGIGPIWCNSSRKRSSNAFVLERIIGKFVIAPMSIRRRIGNTQLPPRTSMSFRQAALHKGNLQFSAWNPVAAAFIDAHTKMDARTQNYRTTEPQS